MDPRAPFANIVVVTDVSVHTRSVVTIGTIGTIGTRRRTGRGRVLLGSVAKAMIHATTCDVFVARLRGSS